jgi:hypothetical protein
VVVAAAALGARGVHDDGAVQHVRRRQHVDRAQVRVVRAHLVQLIPELREGSDNGNPVAARPETEAGAVFAEMARVLDEEMKSSKRAHPELKLLS